MNDGHRTAERRSLALHRAIARELDDATLALARARVEGWLAAGRPVDPAHATRWRAVLEGDVATVSARVVADDDEMRDLRQSTPFAGLVADAERWRIVREVR